MEEGDFIKFLGTAGARFVVTRQLRASGGVWFCLEGVNFLLDPGPGSLVRCLSSKPKHDPARLEAILLSHLHLDHSNDINIMIEAMTEGGFKPRGEVFVPQDALEERVVLPYVRGYCKQIHVLHAGGHYTIADKVRFSTPVLHQHGPETYGFLFETPRRRIAYITCTEFFPDLEKAYSGDVLILHVVRYLREQDPAKSPPAARLPPACRTGRDGQGRAGIKHLTVDDARRLIRVIRPRTAILTHFGMTMLRAKPWEVAAALSKETGVDVIAATDGLRYTFD